MIPLLNMAPHVRFSGAFCINPSNRMETRLLDLQIVCDLAEWFHNFADCHPLVSRFYFAVNVCRKKRCTTSNVEYFIMVP